ncbi:ATPase AAA [Candidatus Thiomargarita nelsonii]|uniref:ATPase AAA n=1 Tax=Candidatus Thiomargarita nelsonii TaxID=1003181 RepID=A0A0A6RM74_9GAMM|nr:ATPase AAA [Candidatus Thiomargarita nelsonii]
MYPRYSKTLLKELLDEFRILYLTGPRQAGKTTLALQIADDLGMQYVSLDEPTVLASAQSDPHGFIDSFMDQPVVLDEFQSVPELITAIKLASDQLQPDERGRFFLTGSADIFSSAKTQEGLPGHLARIELYPLSVTEIAGNHFNLIDFLLADSLSVPDNLPRVNREQFAQTLINGGYPELQSKSPRARQIWFQSYIQGRLFKDFESIYTAKGDYHTKLKTLIPYLAGLSGNLLKYASIANDLALNDKVVKSYIEALEWMFIVKRIYPFVKNRAKRQTIGMPKLHTVDTGLACHLLGLKKPQQLLTSTFYGGLLESFVVMECFKHLAWAEESMNIYHFRDVKKNEVDIILEQADGYLIGIEVKASSTVRESDFKGLRKLAEWVGGRLKYGLVFYTGSRLLPFSGENKRYYAMPLSVLWSQ